MKNIDDIQENAVLKKWYLDFMQSFREKASALSKEEKSRLKNNDNYLEPCQIEVFWIKSPPVQLIVKTRFPNRDDREVLIHGPFTTNEFRSKVEEILCQPRWNVPIKDSFVVDMDSNHQYTYAERLAEEIHRFIEFCKHSIFEMPFSEYRNGTAFDDKIWLEYHLGNIGKEDQDVKVEEIIARIKSESASDQNKGKTLTDSYKSQPIAMKTSKEKWDGFGAHLFPPHVVGQITYPSIGQILYGNSSRIDKSKAFDLKIDDCVIIVNKDGFIFVEFEDKADAIKILNVIMALGILEGLALFAVREKDLTLANYDKKNMKMGEHQWNIQTTRAALHDFNSSRDSIYGYRFEEVETERLKRIIQKAFDLNSDENLMEDLRLFSESFTHIKNGEHAPSFIINWIVIERHYANLWKDALKTKKLSKERLGKLTNPHMWTIDRIIESLNLLEEITNHDYDTVSELKKKRNDLIHHYRNVSLEDAQKCLNVAIGILKQRLTLKSI